MKNLNQWLGLLLGAGALTTVGLLTAPGCQTLKCGAGTVEIDGECTAAGENVGGHCAGGTRFDESSGQCVADICDGGTCGICDPGTTQAGFDEMGRPICIGTGTGPGCQSAGACPAPAAGKFQMCGRIYDLETTTQVEDAETTGKLEVKFYNALAFANNPADPSAFLGTGILDECGRFNAGPGVTVPATQFVAIGIDDEAGGSDEFVNTGVVVTGVTNGTSNDIIAFSATKATDMKWSTSAGLGGGDTFESLGAYVPIFLDPSAADAGDFEPLPGKPTAGVTIQVAGAAPDPDQDYYFTDATPLVRTTLSATPPTGATGTAIYIEGGLVMYSGTGGEPAGCTWPSTLASTIPGVYFVQERIAECE